MYGRADQPADAPGSSPRVTEPPRLRPPGEAVRRSSPSRLRPGHSARTDTDLLRLAREGDPLAYEAIVARYREPLRRACARIVPERAEDAVQQALISAWLALERGAEVRELRPWLYSIARNAAIDQARGIRAELVELGPEVAGGEDPAHAEARRQEVTDVLEAVAALPDRQRRALVATALHGRATEAVAVDLGLSGGALRQLVHRARTNVRAAVPSLGVPIPAWLAEFLGEEGARRGVVLLSSGSGAALLAKTTATVATVGAVITSGVQLEPPRAGASSGASGVPVARVATQSEDQVAARSTLVSVGALVPAASAPVVAAKSGQPAAPSSGEPAAAGEGAESSKHRAETHERPTLGLSAAPAGDHEDGHRRSGRTDRDRAWRAPVGTGDNARGSNDSRDASTSGAERSDRQRGGDRGADAEGGRPRPSRGGADHSQTASPSSNHDASTTEDAAPTTAAPAPEAEPTTTAALPTPLSAEPTDATSDRDNSSAGPSSE